MCCKFANAGKLGASSQIQLLSEHAPWEDMNISFLEYLTPTLNVQHALVLF